MAKTSRKLEQHYGRPLLKMKKNLESLKMLNLFLKHLAHYQALQSYDGSYR